MVDESLSVPDEIMVPHDIIVKFNGFPFYVQAGTVIKGHAKNFADALTNVPTPGDKCCNVTTT